MLAPLTNITSTKVKFKWTKIEQYAFDEINRIVDRNNLINYPDFNEEYKIHIDASKFQLRAVISQKDKPIDFYVRKLNDAPERYTVKERELISIVETQKEFKTILLGQILRIFIDNKNLTYGNFITDRVLIWRIILEGYVLDI